MTWTTARQHKADQAITAIASLDSPLAIACSGGRDSAVLAHLALKSGRDVTLVHVHHHLRESAHRDSAAARAIAERLGLPIREVHLDARHGAGNLQERAGALRMRALVQQTRTMGARALLTGHHGQDRIETFLFQLGRGAGLAAAGNPRPERRVDGCPVIRPLLQWTREDLDAWLRVHPLEHAEDPSNLQSSATRNLLRREVVAPWLRMTSANRILASLDDLEDSATALRELLQPLLEATVLAWRPRGALLSRPALSRLSPVVQRALLQQVLSTLALPAQRTWLQRMTQALGASGVRRIPGAGISGNIGTRVLLVGAGNPSDRNASVLDTPAIALSEALPFGTTWDGLLGTLRLVDPIPAGAWHLPHETRGDLQLQAAGADPAPHALAADAVEAAHLPTLERRDGTRIDLRFSRTPHPHPGWLWTPRMPLLASTNNNERPFRLHHQADDLG